MTIEMLLNTVPPETFVRLIYFDVLGEKCILFADCYSMRSILDSWEKQRTVELVMPEKITFS